LFEPQPPKKRLGYAGASPHQSWALRRAYFFEKAPIPNDLLFPSPAALEELS
jgi:hypothetical protein